MLFLMTPKRVRRLGHCIWKLTAGKGLAIKNVVLSNPLLPAKNVVELLRQQGITTNEGNVDIVRHLLRRQGVLVDRPIKRTSVVLDSDEARIRKALFYNKGKKNVPEIAEKLNISHRQVKYFTWLMRRESVPVKFKGITFKPIPVLSAEQKKVLIKAKPFVFAAVQRNSFRYHFSSLS
jgi:hypothetical protein